MLRVDRNQLIVLILASVFITVGLFILILAFTRVIDGYKPPPPPSVTTTPIEIEEENKTSVQQR